MARVQLIIDIYAHHNEARRAERWCDLPGVPAVGEWIDVTRRMLTLTVRGVRWDAVNGTVMLFLGAGDSGRESIVDRDGAVEMRDYQVEDLRTAGWSIED